MTLEASQFRPHSRPYRCKVRERTCGLVCVMSDPFDFRLQARRPATFVWLLSGLAGAALAWSVELPTLGGALLIACVLPHLWRLCVNARQGFTLGPRTVELFAPGLHRVIPIPRIDRVEITGLPRGVACDLVLTNGETLRLPAGVATCPATVGAAFRARGIPVLA